MKKLLFGMVLALMFVVLMAPVAVFADDGENFKKAGQQALQEREEILFSKLSDIETYVQIAGADRVVTKDEMVILRDRISDFTQTKAEADEYLKVYELKTYTELNKSLSESVNNYFDLSFLVKKDYGQKVKRYFAEATGQDVMVQRGMVALDFQNIGLMVVAALLLFLAIFLALPVGGGRKIGGTVAVSIFFVGLLLLLFLG